MVVGLGVDVFDVSRMEQALREGDPGFERGLFTDDEIAYCRRQHHPAAHFAARFAVKEAVLKALALDGASGASWRSVELSVTPGAAPAVILHGPLKEIARVRGIVRVLASFSHAGGLVAASAVLES
jgi:holo-[acyl-carrier protein] synthase